MTGVFDEILIAAGMGAAKEDMRRYAELLTEKNKVMNLTRITDEAEMAKKHFVDSAHPEICSVIKKGARVIDVGTGGGFPGVPLKLMRPDIDITFLDAVRKKLDFVKESLESMNIEASYVNKRAEEASEYFNKFDVVVSRAVASLPVLLELCFSFCKKGGKIIAYKGAFGEEELQNSSEALKKLSLKFLEKRDIEVDGASHCILVFERKTLNAPGYPRAYAKIKKRPLAGTGEQLTRSR